MFDFRLHRPSNSMRRRRNKEPDRIPTRLSDVPTMSTSSELGREYRRAAFCDDAAGVAAKLGGEIRTKFLDAPRPMNIVAFAKGCREFRLVLIDGTEATKNKPVRLGRCLAIGALVLGSDVIRRWWDWMVVERSSKMPLVPPMPTLREIDERFQKVPRRWRP